MTKEEMIQELTQLKQRLGQDVDSHNIDNRASKIEEISTNIENLERKIKYLDEKVQNDANYIDKTPLQYCMAEEASDLEDVRAKDKALMNNAEQILHEQVIIDHNEGLIALGEEEINKLNADDIVLNVAIRKARLSNNSEKIASLESQISKNENRRKEIIEMSEETRKIIEEHKNVKESIEQLTEGLKEQKNEAQAKYERALAKEAELKNGALDLAQKENDEIELESAKTLIKTLEQQSKAIEYNFEGELDSIITDFQNSTISETEMKSRLRKLQENLPKEFVQEDAEKRQAELAENQRAQETLEVQVDRLTRKLSNEDNYKLSPVEYQKMRTKLSTIDKRDKEYDLEQSYIETQIASISSDQKEYEEILSLCDVESEEIQRQIILNNGNDKELEQELNSRRDANFQTRREAIEMLSMLATEQVENNQVKAQLEDRKARNAKLRESYQARVADPDALNKSQVRLDTLELTQAKASLEALKNREAYLNNSITQNINRILGVDVRTKIDTPVTPVINDEQDVTLEPIPVGTVNEASTNLPFPSEDGIDPNVVPVSVINDAILDDAKKDDVVAPIMDSKDIDDKDAVVAPIINPDDIKSKYQNPVGQFMDDEEKDEKFEVVDEYEDENLKEKAKAKPFRNKLKAFLKKLLIIVALIATLGAASKFANRFSDMSSNQDYMETVTSGEATEEDLDNAIDALKEAEELSSQDKIDNLSNDGKTSIDDLKNDKTTATGEIQSQENLTEAEKEAIAAQAGHSTAPYTETFGGTTEQVAAPVASESIVDTNKDVQDGYVNYNKDAAVDPSTIKDPNANSNTTVVVPPASTDQGEKVEKVEGVTGNETVSDDAWANEKPIIENQTQQDSTETVVTPTTPEVSDTVIDSNEEVVIEPSTEVTVPETNPTITDTNTTNLTIGEGEGIILEQNGTTYVGSNGADMSNIVNNDAQDLFASDSVISAETDEKGNLIYTVNSNDLARPTELTDEEVSEIQSGNVSQEEIDAINAAAGIQSQSEIEQLELLKQQLTESLETSNENIDTDVMTMR